MDDSLILSGGITKSSSSRYIPLNDEANHIMQQLYKKSESKNGLVFPSKNNQPPGPKYIRIGRSIRYLKDDLDLLLDQHREKN